MILITSYFNKLMFVYKRARCSCSVLIPSRVSTEWNCETKVRFGRWVALRERPTTLIIMGPIVFGGRPLVGYYRGCPRGDHPKLVVNNILLVVLGKGTPLVRGFTLSVLHKVLTQ